MKRFVCLLLAFVLAMALLAGCSQKPSGNSGGEDTLPAVTFNYSSNFPQTHRVSALDEAWFAQLKEKANITITPYWSNTLCSAASPYTETASGLSDITHIAPGNEKEHFIIENAIQFFFYGTTNKQALYEATVELFETTPEWQAEYKGVKVLFMGSMGDLYLFTKDLITNVKDLNGISIRVTEDQAFSLVEKMGGTGVRMPVSELFENLDKGVVHGIINGTNTIEQYQLAELLGYGLNLGLSGSFCVHCYINEDSWNKLTAGQQAILMETAEERAMAQVVAIDEWTAASGEYCLGTGMVINELTPEEQAALDAFYEALALEKVEELNAAGYDGQAIFERARALVEKYSKMYEGK